MAGVDYSRAGSAASDSGPPLRDKILTNYGLGACKALGLRGYLRYLATTLFALPAILRQRSLRPVDVAMHGLVSLRHPVTGLPVRIDLDVYRPSDEEEGTFTFGLVREIWMRNVYLKPFRWPPRLDCVIDLGANRGVFALQACHFAEQVIAVEVMGKYAAPLQRNLALNHLANLTLVKAFIGGEGFMAPGDGAVIGLHQAMAMAGERAIDFMKIDIEGSEFGLDLSPLARVKRLAMEVHPRWGDPASLISEVTALGFECRLFDDAMRRVGVENVAFIYAINTRFPEATWT